MVTLVTYLGDELRVEGDDNGGGGEDPSGIGPIVPVAHCRCQKAARSMQHDLQFMK